MARILLIETSTAQLSVALAEDGLVVASRTSGEPRMQASLTAPFVQEVLDGKGLSVRDLDAVCVGKGPGSYTGLRVGVSTAKGLCFGAGIPLLSAGTLDVLVSEAHRLGAVPEGCRYIVPMVDARRMEVYAAVFTPDGRQLTATEPVIVGADSFAAERAEGPVLFIGDGALKCRETLVSENAFFAEAFPTAMAMAPLAETAFNEKRFEDIAYFEPFYLKDFVATVSRKKLF
ncbi:MAG: tRNA (adenosine(37)-N6)-threonylcarbamoyltransferase complex dimerization subunit type 1 TsaB [Bacteroidales bacterium]|jgi:tRNA threonylcarbamoyladenosine biosynthesis protein TsaB|nr:tRNA (adenosine(37)-N6)-threonylcarbamoyltransferase complex dimerization subunit type 1 TsaB [Bacteroidales bacterium]